MGCYNIHFLYFGGLMKQTFISFMLPVLSVLFFTFIYAPCSDAHTISMDTTPSHKENMDPENNPNQPETLRPLDAPLNKNPGFENGLDGWNVFIHDSIKDDARIVVQDKQYNPNFANEDHSLWMLLPEKATNNTVQFITLGQNLYLFKNRKYRYSVKIQWMGGELPNAIVSTWTRNPDGSYNGVDLWIDHTNPETHTFEFIPNEDGNVYCYISLLTNIYGFKDTSIIVDDLIIEDIGPAPVDEDPRDENQNLLLNSGFDDNFANWSFTENNPHNVLGLVSSIETGDYSNNYLHLELPSAHNNTYLNKTWTGIYQTVRLYAGNTYEISAIFDRILPDDDDIYSIVNVYAYKPPTETRQEQLGSIDYKFWRLDRHTYKTTIIPRETTDYDITFRVFGWGNEGRAIQVDIDDIQLKRIVE